jgi:hypothetical protein
MTSDRYLKSDYLAMMDILTDQLPYDPQLVMATPP